MKQVIVLTFLSLIFSFPVFAADDSIESDQDILAYCEEQAASAGIEDATEKSQYVQDCAANFGVTVAEEPPLE